jgi:deazaflavin-dependent oxidoreductase (nitroreductase family)|tara:strand:- start:300 stop:833 length:534 start_codon:yes stop_codon:yes gene_type:complete
MSALRELGLEVKPANAFQRLVQAVGSSRPGAWLFSKTLYQPDKVLFKATGGRLTIPTLVAGLPVIMVTTTGAKTGKRRTMPLLGIPVGEDLAVIGSNYGQKHTPSWVYNLEADPSATIRYRDCTVEVVARRADETETDRIFDLASTVYPGYAKYRKRADHRVIQVFVLETDTQGVAR